MKHDKTSRFVSSDSMIDRVLFISLFLLTTNALTIDGKIIGDDKPVFERSFNDDQHYVLDDCVPLAFGDFNADKVVDIFCRNSKGDSLRVMLNSDRSLKAKEQYRINTTGIIHDALAADFDGDSKLDLFLLYKVSEAQSGYNGGFLWGDRVKLSDLQTLPYQFGTIPTPLDGNGYSYVDLLGMMSTDGTNYQPACLTFKNRTVLNFIQLTSVRDRLLPHSTQATVDLTNDLVADLFLTLDHQSQPLYQIHRLPITQLELIKEYNPPSQVALYHLSTFSDIDGDGQLEHLLPVCMDANCLDSRIYVREHDQWYQVPIRFGDGIRFPLKHELPSPFNQVAFSMKMSDYNLDGYPDIAVVMKNSLTGSTVPMILQNSPCKVVNNISCTYDRTFVPQTDETSLAEATNTNLAVFFDLLENGYPDLLIVQGNTTGNMTLTGFQNSLVQDVHFFKVMVLSSFSCRTCSHQNKLPYGSNQPGQSMKMETISIRNGLKDDWVQLAAVQMSQAGQLTLELPYVIIGLGATPNFVEKLTIGLPPNVQSDHLIRTYTQMIPNSQIVVIPTPLMDPDRWQSKLFVTASRMILHTGIALGVTLLVIAVVMALLQYRERMDDSRERKEQSQTFHYDAL